MSDYVYGIHDPGPWMERVRQKLGQGWCIHTEAVGCDPFDRSGKNFATTGLTNVVRINNGYGQGTGTIPTPNRYHDFARRVANFVAASQGIHYVIIGNEIALSWEWPTAQPIALNEYLTCYKLCYAAIKAVAPQVKVGPQAPAPWNASTPDAPDWIGQLSWQLLALGDMVDFVPLHAYSRGYGGNVFTSGARMSPPYQQHFSGWETLYEYMAAIPASHRHLPVLVTEVNGNEPWPAHNSGWVQQMYSWINSWNLANPQKILCAALFRWAPHDRQWDLSDRAGTVTDFLFALDRRYWHGYRETAGKEIVVVDASLGLNLRDGPNGKVLKVLRDGTALEVKGHDGDWLNIVVLETGEAGYVYSKYTKRP